MTTKKEEATLFGSPDVYRELSVPFENIDAANAAFTKFQEELYELRVKYKIRDLLFVVMIPVTYESGDSGEPICVGHFGDEGKSEAMAHYAAGRTSAERQERIAKIAAQGCKAIRPAKPRR